MHLGRVGLWTFQLDLQPASAARETVAELEELGYPTIWLPEAVGREPFVNSALLLGRHRADGGGHRDRQRVGPRRHDDGGRAPLAERGLRRPLPARPRGEPPADGRLRARPPVRQAAHQDARVPRRDGQGDLHGAPARRGAAPRARRPRPEDARAGRRQGARRAPVLRAGRAHRVRPRGARRRADALPRAGGGARHRPRAGPGRRPPPHGDVPHAARTTRTTCGGSAGATTTSATAAATSSSTPSWRGATRPRSSPACRPTSTPAPTTCACRCCGDDATALPMEEWRRLAEPLRSL